MRFACPHCGGSTLRNTRPTQAGCYYVCSDCSHMWQLTAEVLCASATAPSRVREKAEQNAVDCGTTRGQALALGLSAHVDAPRDASHRTVRDALPFGCPPDSCSSATRCRARRTSMCLCPLRHDALEIAFAGYSKRCARRAGIASSASSRDSTRGMMREPTLTLHEQQRAQIRIVGSAAVRLGG